VASPPAVQLGQVRVHPFECKGAPTER
jgi:hypothetical protein